MAGGKAHWESVHRSKSLQELSWYQTVPAISLTLIDSVAQSRGDAIIDVGAGVSNLVDHLLANHYRDITLLDIAESALMQTRRRLADDADRVEWHIGDICHYKPPRAYDIWHDRAVFHFLTDPQSRSNYRQVLRHGLKRGGYLILAAFAPNGPERCSGLPIVQYDRKTIQAELGESFQLLDERSEDHITPKGKVQAFNYFLFQYLPQTIERE